MADVARWRAQLADEDSDEDDFHGGAAAIASHARQNSDTFDDMGLDLDEPPISALNKHIRSASGPIHSNAKSSLSAEGRELVLEQRLQSMQSQLQQKELELEAALDAAAAMQGGGAGGVPDAREAKVREIVKRSKAAMMALGRERAKNAQLMAELAALKSEANSAHTALPPETAGPAARLQAATAAVRDARDGLSSQQQLDREVKELKSQVSSLGAKLHSQKTTNETLRSELNKYQRALAREVGEEVPATKLKELLDDTSGAKGRAQQITLLREQVRDLQRRLASNTCEGGTLAASIATEDRQQRNLSAIEVDRRRELERLALRETQLEGELSEAKRKSEAQLARIKILEDDVRGKKEKMIVLLRKSEDDDALVAALRAELERRKAAANGGSPSKHGGGDDASRRQELASRAAQQQAQIDRQEQIILALRDQLQRQEGSMRGSSGQRQPQDLIMAQAENAKLRELVALLQDKLRDYED